MSDLIYPPSIKGTVETSVNSTTMCFWLTLKYSDFCSAHSRVWNYPGAPAGRDTAVHNFVFQPGTTPFLLYSLLMFLWDFDGVFGASNMIHEYGCTCTGLYFHIWVFVLLSGGSVNPESVRPSQWMPCLIMCLVVVLSYRSKFTLQIHTLYQVVAVREQQWGASVSAVTWVPPDQIKG